MLPSEFWLMCEGYREYKDREYEFLRSTVFAAMRWHAGTTALVEKKDRDKIYKHRFPWEKGYKKQPENPKDRVLSYDKMKGIFNVISKEADGDE